MGVDLCRMRIMMGLSRRQAAGNRSGPTIQRSMSRHNFNAMPMNHAQST